MLDQQSNHAIIETRTSPKYKTPMSQNSRCEPIAQFPFFEISDFEYVQLKSSNKFTVTLYRHIETNIYYIIKEVSFDHKRIGIYQVLFRIRSPNIVPAFGLSLMRYRIGKVDSPQRSTGKQQSHDKEVLSMLVLMQHCQMNLIEYVDSRRKNMLNFKREEINSFLLQMLTILQKLQREGIAHRDIKPSNILYHKGIYMLCDFEDSVVTHQSKEEVAVGIDLTTVQYSPPEFLINIRQPKWKVFDPYKLDVYSLGLTLLYLCSMGRFSLEERLNYLYSDNSSHAEFIREQTRKYLRENIEYASFNSLLKMMLQEDQYKRDDFITLLIKIRQRNGEEIAEYSISDENHTNSQSKHLNRQHKKSVKLQQTRQLQSQQTLVYGILNVLFIIVFVILCIF